MDFRILGPLQVLCRDKPVALGGPKQRTVLALLLVHVNTVVSTDRLLDELYGEAPPEAARKSLQSFVANLRKALNVEGEVLRGQAPGYILEASSAGVDAVRFEETVREAQALLADDPEAALARLTDALALWQGRPFDDVAESPALASEATRLEELRLVALEDRIEADLALGHHQAILPELKVLTTDHPLRERFHAQYMLALYRSDRQADALRVYQRMRTFLADEMGIDPSPALQQLELQILQHDSDLDATVDSPLGPEVTIDQPSRPMSEAGFARSVRGYELRERIGSGGFGTVYRAYQGSMGREVAMKVFDPELVTQPAFVRGFEAEAQQLALLEHPHIVSLFDYWRDPDGAYLVMRWLRGGNLVKALDRGPWNAANALNLLEQVGGALARGHRYEIVHRGLTPNEVLLDEDGNGYLSDFGLGARLADVSDHAPPGSSLGYLSPEERAGEPVSPRSNVYTMGILTFELLTGHLPAGDEARPAASAVRPDLPAQINDVIATATAELPADRYESIEAFVAAARQAMGGAAPAATTAPARNPYKGLRPFAETDSEDFFGRRALTEQLLGSLQQPGAAGKFLAVVGPSGSGKSSVVRAGLLPALRRGAVPGSAEWFCVEMTPGSDPLEELEAALLRIAINPPVTLLDQLRSDTGGLRRAVKRVLPGDESELLLLIDQFEEIFTLVDDEARRAHFLASLVEAVTDPRSRLRVVVTMRADFYDRPLRYAVLGDLITSRMVTVKPLTPQELQEAVTKPAAQLGVEFEAGLEAQIVTDVTAQPGALPLLQYALTELFEQRERRSISWEAYHALGGVAGALGQRAEELYVGLGPPERAAARQSFLRLIAISEGNEATRRRAPRRELTALGNRQSVEDVLDTFGTARLLTFDRDPVTRAPTVEVAHEALLREWARLYRWIEEARVDVRLERRLASATAEWTAADRDASYLLAGNRLDLFEAWRSGTDIALTSIEQEFLETSIEKRTALELAEASRREREERLERRSVTRLRFLAAVLAVAAIVAASLTVFAFNQRDRARDQTDLAERQAELAQRNAVLSNARALTAEAVTSVAVDPQLSILLALAAADETTSVGEPVLTETIEALHLALPASRVRMTLPGGSGSFSPDGRRLVTADPGILRSQGDAQGTATVWDVASGTEVLVLTGHTGRTFDAVFSPDGSRIATTSSDGTARLWDASTGSLERALSGHQGSVFAVEFNPDGSLVATTGADGTVRIWDTATGEELLKLDVGTTATGLAFSTDGKLAVAADQQGVLLWDVATGTRLATLDAGGEGMCDVAFGPDGALVATVSLDQTVRLWDALTGVELRSFEGHNGPVCGVDFSPDGGRLATAGEDGVARIWEIETGRNVLTLAGHDTGVGTARFNGDGSLLVTASGDGTTKLWDVGPTGSREWMTVAGHRGRVTTAAYSPDGTFLATAGEDGAVVIWDAASGALLRSLVGHIGPVRAVAVSPSGTEVITAGEDGTARVWDVDSGRELVVLNGHTDKVWDAEFSPDGSRAVTAGLDGTTRVWDVASGAELLVLESPTQGVFSAAFSPDGTLIAAGAVGVQLWDATTGDELIATGGDRGFVASVAFSEDGRSLAAGGFDATITVWDVTGLISEGEAAEAVLLSGHTGLITAVAFSPDGTLLASSGLDNTVRLWETAGQEGLIIRGVAAPGAPSFSPDGSLLAVPTGDGTAQVYTVHVEDLLDLARSRLTRGFTPAECARYPQLRDCPPGS